jgi:hypothetical protein
MTTGINVEKRINNHPGVLPDQYTAMSNTTKNPVALKPMSLAISSIKNHGATAGASCSTMDTQYDLAAGQDQ